MKSGRNDTTSRIKNFKMLKRTSIMLEYPVQSIEWIAPERTANLTKMIDGISFGQI